ncbi:MAG: DUF3105 domain-containing protein [Gaiellaceae bacterium]
MPPKPRTSTKKPAGSRPLLPLLLGASGLVMLTLVLGWMLLGGDSGVDSAKAETAKTALEQAGCTLTVVKALKNASDHSDVPSPDARPKWNTFPPTNGPHYGEAALFGAYEEPLEQARVVHNLEHGGVYVQYGKDVPDATVAELKGFYDDHLNGTLLAPLPELGKTIALGAWVAPDSAVAGAGERGSGYLAKCTTFDESAYAAFFDAYQFKGPERFPASAMAPGS